jgi:hypothetical protein
MRSPQFLLCARQDAAKVSAYFAAFVPFMSPDLTRIQVKVRHIPGRVRPDFSSD